jgi:hypothetical protein
MCGRRYQLRAANPKRDTSHRISENHNGGSRAASTTSQLVVVLNRFEELKRRVLWQGGRV